MFVQIARLDATQIAGTLDDGLGPKWSTTIYGPRTQYNVLLELDPKFQRSRSANGASSRS